MYHTCAMLTAIHTNCVHTHHCISSTDQMVMIILLPSVLQIYNISYNNTDTVIIHHNDNINTLIEDIPMYLKGLASLVN